MRFQKRRVAPLVRPMDRAILPATTDIIAINDFRIVGLKNAVLRYQKRRVAPLARPMDRAILPATTGIIAINDRRMQINDFRIVGIANIEHPILNENDNPPRPSLKREEQ
jgi:hypothetical protein